MHLKMFRFLADMAAEYIPTHIKMLHQARERKARQGLYAGLGAVPKGYNNSGCFAPEKTHCKMSFFRELV